MSFTSAAAYSEFGLKNEIAFAYLINLFLKNESFG